MTEAATTSRQKSTVPTALTTVPNIPPGITTPVPRRVTTWCRSRATTRRLPITVHHLRQAGAAAGEGQAQAGVAVGTVRAQAGAAAGTVRDSVGVVGHVRVAQAVVIIARHRPATAVAMVVTIGVVAATIEVVMDRVGVSS